MARRIIVWFERAERRHGPRAVRVAFYLDDQAAASMLLRLDRTQLETAAALVAQRVAYFQTDNPRDVFITGQWEPLPGFNTTIEGRVATMLAGLPTLAPNPEAKECTNKIA